jgi:hypothetical protein
LAVAPLGQFSSTGYENMWQRLKNLVYGKPAIHLQHAFFGKIRFMGGNAPSATDYWETELSIDGTREPLTVLINAPASGPDAHQVAFYQQAVSDPDALFEKCWPVFEPDFREWTGKEFSGNWRDDFEIMSIEIPANGYASNEWSVGYFVEAANHYFTARFIDGKPTCNEIDG